MTNEELEKKIFEVVAYQAGVPVESLNRDLNFHSDLDIDPFDYIVLGMAVERSGVIREPIDDQEFSEKVKTINDLINLVKEIREREAA